VPPCESVFATRDRMNSTSGRRLRYFTVSGVDAVAVLVQRRPGDRRTQAGNGREAAATPAGALPARQAGHGGHARGRTSRPCRVGPNTGRPARPAHGRLGAGIPKLCIIPFEAAVPVFPLSGFRLYDDLVIVESIVGEQQLAEADDVARYEKYLELLRDAASTGTEAAAVIRRSLESLR